MTCNHDEPKPLFDPPRNGFSYGIGSGTDFRPYTYGELTDEYEEKLKLLDEKTETIRSQDEKIKKLELKSQLLEGAMNLREQWIAERDEKIRRLREYVHHNETCASLGWEAGEPTPDGGYRTKIRGKWYQSRPIDETPKCTCGAEEIFQETSDTKEVE